MMDLDCIKKVNLIEQLSECYPHIEDLSEEEIHTWDEDQIRAYYTEARVPQNRDSSAHTDDQVRYGMCEANASPLALLSCVQSLPDGRDHNGMHLSGQIDTAQAGGGVKQLIDPRAHTQPPPAVRKNQIAATVQGYRTQAIADGIPIREHGLFPPGDPLLLKLASEPSTYPFEKHLAGESSSYEVLKQGSWTSGDEAAQAGFDLRLFYKECTGPSALVVRSAQQQKYGTIHGAARLGDRASIGNGYWMSAHGGAVESLLDEATAELGKMEFSPMLSTIEADFKIRKSVPLHTTLKIECEVKEVKGMRCWVNGYVKDESGIVLASCVAQLVDLQQLWAAQGQQ